MFWFSIMMIILIPYMSVWFDHRGSVKFILFIIMLSFYWKYITNIHANEDWLLIANWFSITLNFNLRWYGNKYFDLMDSLRFTDWYYMLFINLYFVKSFLIICVEHFDNLTTYKPIIIYKKHDWEESWISLDIYVTANILEN